MLDFTKLLPQIHEYVDRHAARDEALTRAIDAAREQIAASSADWQAWRDRVREARTSWLVGEPLEEPAGPRALPALAEDHIALATDGSQIAPDRHEVAGCWLVNVGMVAIRYGAETGAKLESFPKLFDADDDPLAGDDVPATAGPAGPPPPPPGAGDKSLPGGSSLALRRYIEECGSLARLIRDTPPGVSSAAMVDGTLIPWSAESAPDAVRRRIVAETQALLNVAREHRVPVVGYISRPGSRDVVNATRVARCPYTPADCARHCPSADPRRPSAPCTGVEAATDALVFDRMLRSGERAGCFASASKILREFDDANRIVFTYLATGAEISRLELPRWVFDDPAMLDLAHAIAFDQARKGGGYPRVLTEAHELAVVRGADRVELFRQIETLYVRQHVPARVTRKALSKRVRGV